MLSFLYLMEGVIIAIILYYNLRNKEDNKKLPKGLFIISIIIVGVLWLPVIIVICIQILYEKLKTIKRNNNERNCGL